MKRRSALPLIAAAATVFLALAACTGSKPGAWETSGGYNAALHAVANASSHKGGTIIFDYSTVPDSTDPGNTYHAEIWNLLRLYGRALVTYKSAPGAAGMRLVPDLATSLGKVSDNGLTWTYHLKPGIRYESGGTVTSRDVKYAIERSYARYLLPNGPGYFAVLLKDPGYPGPYKDTTPGRLGLASVGTPDPATIVFHLQRPFSDFDYVAALPQTVPVPAAQDTGASYQLHPVSTGPYKFQSYHLDKQLTLVKNPHWDPATDPNRSQLAGKIVVNLNVNADRIDQNLIHDFADLDLAGTGVGPAARAQILASAPLKNNADNALTNPVCTSTTSDWSSVAGRRTGQTDSASCTT